MKVAEIPDFVHELLEAANKGYVEIALKAEDLFKLPVVITNSLYQPIVSSLDKFIEGNFEIDFHYPFEPSYDSDLFTCHWKISGHSLEAIGHPILHDTNLLGYFFLITKHEELLEIEEKHKMIDYITSLISFQMQKNNQIHKEKLRFKEAFLFNLLYGNFKKKSEIISYGSIWHWDFDQPSVIVTFSLKDFDPFSEDTYLLDLLANIVETSLIQHTIEPILLKKHTEVISILPINEKTNFMDKKTFDQCISYIMKQTKRTKIIDRAVCGVGKIYNEANELFRSYQEAKVALELGILLKKEIPHFNDLGIERILYKHDVQELKEFYNRVLGKLILYDKETKGELVSTLECFATNQFDLKQTSEALYLHRNTLRYRMKKIEEILNIKLDNMETRLDIIVALKIKRLHNL